MKDLINFENEHLKVLEYTRHIEGLGHHWKIQCKHCQNIFETHTRRLLNTKIKSCGCLKSHQALRLKHGDARKSVQARLYRIWCCMKERCFNSNISDYPRYGGRGITVCEEWLGEHGYENFRDWALANGYASHLTIDRILNNGNYEPGNCKWSTKKEQDRNRRSNRLVTVLGETCCVAEALEKYGVVSNSRAVTRLNAGWTDEEAILLPAMKETLFFHDAQGFWDYKNRFKHLDYMVFKV